MPLTKRELADGIRIVVYRQAHENSPDAYSQPVSFGGLSCRNQEHWLNVAEAAATLTGYLLGGEEE